MAWVVVMAGLGVSGCGGAGLGGGPDYPVKGRVLLADGKPLGTGRVVFVSDETALSHGGAIASDGSFELKQGSRAGAPAGHYKVRVDVEESHASKARTKTTNLRFSAKYADEDASRLTALVKASGENFFEFKLTK
jgi:predicted outer membrane repeat protein